jgi:hypothetical protein
MLASGELIERLSQNSIEELDLKFQSLPNFLPSPVQESISSCLSLAVLDLWAVDLTENGVLALCDALYNNTSLRSLDLGANILSVESLEMLTRSLGNLTAPTPLESLCLSKCEIKPAGSPVLCTLISSLLHLEHLNLSHNQLDDACGVAIAGVLGAPTSSLRLKRLNLYHNFIRKRGGLALLEVASTMSLHIDLEANLCGDMQSLERTVQRNHAARQEEKKKKKKKKEMEEMEEMELARVEAARKVESSMPSHRQSPGHRPPTAQTVKNASPPELWRHRHQRLLQSSKTANNSSAGHGPQPSPLQQAIQRHFETKDETHLPASTTLGEGRSLSASPPHHSHHYHTTSSSSSPPGLSYDDLLFRSLSPLSPEGGKISHRQQARSLTPTTPTTPTIPTTAAVSHRERWIIEQQAALDAEKSDLFRQKQRLLNQARQVTEKEQRLAAVEEREQQQARRDIVWQNWQHEKVQLTRSHSQSLQQAEQQQQRNLLLQEQVNELKKQAGLAQIEADRWKDLAKSANSRRKRSAGSSPSGATPLSSPSPLSQSKIVSPSKNNDNVMAYAVGALKQCSLDCFETQKKLLEAYESSQKESMDLSAIQSLLWELTEVLGMHGLEARQKALILHRMGSQFPARALQLDAPLSPLVDEG